MSRCPFCSSTFIGGATCNGDYGYGNYNALMDMEETKLMNRYYTIARILFSYSSPFSLPLLPVSMILIRLCDLEEGEFNHTICYLGAPCWEDDDYEEQEEVIPPWLYYAHENKRRPWENCVVVESIRDCHDVFQYLTALNTLDSRANLLLKMTKAAVNSKRRQKGEETSDDESQN